MRLVMNQSVHYTFRLFLTQNLFFALIYVLIEPVKEFASIFFADGADLGRFPDHVFHFAKSVITKPFIVCNKYVKDAMIQNSYAIAIKLCYPGVVSDE